MYLTRMIWVCSISSSSLPSHVSFVDILFIDIMGSVHMLLRDGEKVSTQTSHALFEAYENS